MKRAGTKTTALIIALSMLLTCCTWLTAVFGVKTARAEGAAQWTPDTTLLKANPDSTVRGPFDSTSGFIDIVGQVNGQVQYTVRIDDGSDNRGPVETYPIKTWGGRVGYETQFDFDSFETEIDFTYLNKTPDAPKDTWGEENVKGEQLNLMLSSVTAGLYFGNDGCMITVQRQRDQAATPEDESRNYFFTVTSGGNGTSDVTFKGNGKAPDYANTNDPDFASGYSGWLMSFATDVLSFKISSEGDNYLLTISEAADAESKLVITMPKATLAKGIEEKVYMAYGGLNAGTGVVRFNKLTCDDTKAYEASIASKVATINDYCTAVQDLSDSSKIAAANALRKQVSLDGFRNYDRAYFQPKVDAANELFSQYLDIDSLEDIVEDTLTNLQAKLSNAADNAALAEIYSLAADAATFASMAKELDADRGAALQTKVDEVNADIYEKAKTIVTSYMNAYENAVNSIKNLADLQTSSVKRADAVAYLDKLTDTDKTELYKKLEDTDKVYSEKNSVAGWEGSLKSLAISSDGKTISYGALAGGGMSSDVHTRDASTLSFTESKMAVNNFTMSFSIDKLDASTGWISIGLMAKPNSFSTSQDNDPVDGVPKVQNNPGLMFLISPYANGSAKVELFFIKLTTTDFYAALLNELTFDYEIGKPIEISVKAPDKDKDSYLEISIGGQDFPKKRIDNAAIASVFGKDYEGYLNICQMGGDQSNNCYEVTLNKINGHDAASADIAKVTALPDKNDPEPTPTPNPDPTTPGCGGNVAFAGMAVFGAAALVTAVVAMIRKKRENH